MEAALPNMLLVRTRETAARLTAWRWVTIMTFIIGAIAKNGVFIRSDKRRTIKDESGSIQYFDDMEKLYISTDRKVIIYNHGINIINGKSWYDLAAISAERILNEGPADIDGALASVERAISADVLTEISNNQLEDACGFVVIIKKKNRKWIAGEIFWRKGLDVQKTQLGRFFWSGSGTKYMHPSSKQKDDSHWASIRVIEAKAEIGIIYTSAIKNQGAADGNEFSPDYDDVSVT